MKKKTVNLTYKGKTTEHTLYDAKFRCLEEPWLVSISPDWDFVPDTVKDGNNLVDSHIIKADDPATGDLYKQIHAIIDNNRKYLKWIQCKIEYDEDDQYAASDVARANHYIDTYLRDERGEPFARYKLTCKVWEDGNGWICKSTIDINAPSENAKANLRNCVRCGDIKADADSAGSEYYRICDDDDDIHYGSGNCIAWYCIQEEDVDKDDE